MLFLIAPHHCTGVLILSQTGGARPEPVLFCGQVRWDMHSADGVYREALLSFADAKESGSHMAERNRIPRLSVYVMTTLVDLTLLIA